jgi:hypothetical protein
MRSMPELMLVEEAAERAAVQLRSLMTLLKLSFDAGEIDARRIAHGGRVVDPEASCYFGEARRLLLRPEPNMERGYLALCFAARREPECYGPTFAALDDLLFEGARAAAAAEIAAAETSPDHRSA